MWTSVRENPEAIRLVDECRPRAVMLENVRGLLDAVFDDYRNKSVKLEPSSSSSRSLSESLLAAIFLRFSLRLS